MIHLSLSSYDSFDYTPPPLAWPSQGSAAIDVPALGITRVWHNRVVPIASLTKLMTVYVALKRFPLSIGQTGPCITVSDAQVTSYQEDKSEDDSAVIVEEGEQLCEIDLLDGVLVHSAANYADMLASMVSPTPQAFVARMNATARSLGLHNTRYADDTGVSAKSVSTRARPGEARDDPDAVAPRAFDRRPDPGRPPGRRFRQLLHAFGRDPMTWSASSPDAPRRPAAVTSWPWPIA